MSALNYSKWDAIELSDDEDFECHPNVDKSSMIRWKQAQIHKERRERDDQKDLLTMEFATTEKYLKEMPEKIAALKNLPPPVIPGFLTALAHEIDKSCTDPMRKASMSKMEKWPGNWDAPIWGDILRNHKPWNEEVNNIMKSTEQYITDGKDFRKVGEFVLNLFEESFARFRARQPLISNELKAIEVLMNKKLTMDHMTTGFDKTFVEKQPKAAKAADHKSGSGGKNVETIHTPKDLQADPFMMQIFDEMQSTEKNLLARHPQLLRLSEKGEFGEVYKILKQYPEISNEENEEALLLRALCLSVVEKLPQAKIACQNSMMLKFTRNLGKDGVDVFFSKLQGNNSSAQNLFFGDIANTLEHISKRGAVLRKERFEKKRQMAEAEEKKKEIFKSFLQEDGTLKLPLGPTPSDTDLKQKEWFDKLPEDYKMGLLTEDVDKINAYLGSLPPDEAEFQANIAAKSGFIYFGEEGEDDEEGVESLAS